jgi:hypothetical protein
LLLPAPLPAPEPVLGMLGVAPGVVVPVAPEPVLGVEVAPGVLGVEVAPGVLGVEVAPEVPAPVPVAPAPAPDLK